MTLICGLPNSGKTTYSNRYEDVIHLDDIRQYSECNKIVSAKVDAVVEGVYNKRKHRLQLLSGCRDSYNVCIWMDTPIEECMNREMAYRKRNCFIIYNNKMEPPEFSEGWDEIIIVHPDCSEKVLKGD